MGFRVPQVRELDPQVQIQQQQTMLNPYFNSMMARDESSHNRQLQLMQQRNDAEARKAAADIEGSGAWTRGLDAMTKAAIPAAQGIHGMRIQGRAQDEAEKTGEVSRTNMMENALATRQQRELDAQFAPREREGGIGQTAANTRMIGTQTQGMETANKSANINLQKQELQQAFEQADAAKYGFEGAKPGESVAQYTMRMDAEGKVADVQRVKAESRKMQLEADQMPEELKLRRLNTLASIKASEAATANAYTMAQVAKEDSKRRGETHQVEQLNTRTELAKKNIKEYATNVMNGQLFGKLPEKEQAQIIAQQAKGQLDQLGMSSDPAAVEALVASSITGAVSDQRSAAIALNAAELLSPVVKQRVERNLGQISLANAGSVLIKGLTAKLENYQNSNVVMNSEQAKLAAETIRSDLQQAAAQDKRFEPYLQQFDKINAGIGAGGFLGIDSLRNLTGPSPAKQVESLIEVISDMIQTEINADPVAHPSTAAALELAKQNIGNANNYFLDTSFRRKQQQQQQMPQPAPQQPFFSPVQTRSPVNQPKTMQELDQMFPQARR